MGTGLEIALVGLAAGGTVASVQQGRQARKESAKARKAEQRLQNVRAARERRAAVREARLQRAQIQSGAAQSGVATSSGAVQGAGAVGTQLASNLSFLDQSSALTNQISLFRQRSADASGRASTYSAVSGLAMQGASLFGGKGSEEESEEKPSE